MTENRRTPPKPSLARIYGRLAAKFRRRDDHRTTDDYQRAADRSVREADLRREMRKGEAVWQSRQDGGFGGGFGGGF